MINLDYDTEKAEHRNPKLADERREKNRAEHEAQCRERGNAYVSRSKRRFRAAVVAEPKRAGKRLDGTQLLLALCDLHEKPARRAPAVSLETARARIEARGEAAIAELGEHATHVVEASAGVKKRQSRVLTYISMDGEVLETTLHGLTGPEADYVDRVSLEHTATRSVRWPSQVSNPIVRVEHESES